SHPDPAPRHLPRPRVRPGPGACHQPRPHRRVVRGAGRPARPVARRGRPRRGGAAMSLEADFRIRRGDFELDLELRADPGEVVALLGPNGAGKSTALRAVAGLLAIDEGHITLLGGGEAGDG